MTLIHTITHPSRLHDIKFWKRRNESSEILFAASEDKETSLYEVTEDSEKVPRIFAEMVGHSNRQVSSDHPDFPLRNKQNTQSEGD